MYRVVVFFLVLSSLVYSEVTSSSFQNYFVNAKNIMLFIDPTNGKIMEANHAAKLFYGYENLTNMSIQEINTFTKEQVLNEIKQAKSEQRNYFIFTHRLYNGSTQKVRVFSHPIEFNNKKLLYSIVYPLILENEFIEHFNTTLQEQVSIQAKELDQKHNKITRLLILGLGGLIIGIIVLLLLYRKKVKFQKIIERQNKTIKDEQNSLKMQKKRLELVLEGTGLGLWDWDLKTNNVVFDKGWANMLGYTIEELNPSIETWKSKVHPDDVTKCSKDIKSYLNGDSKVYDNIHRLLHKDGKWRYILDRGKITERDKDGKAKRFTGTHTDITYIKKTELELKKKKYSISQYIHLINKYIITSSTDLDGNITNVSDANCKISGYLKEELLGQNHRLTKHQNTDPKVHQEMWETIIQNKIWTGEIMNQDKFGNTYWVQGTISPRYNEHGKKIGYTSIRQDITDKKLIEELSITDGLTNIFNRRHFNEVFPSVINSAKRDNSLVSFLIIDIDHFKQYNDTYGHQMGDEVLIQVAQCIKDSIHRADDSCFRLGGEEFGVIFKTESKEKAKIFADTIRVGIENLHIKHSGNSASSYVTISLGLVCKNANEIKDDGEIYKDADDQLYKAKESGRNKVEFLL